MENQKPAQRPMKVGANLKNFLNAQLTVIKAMNASKKAKKHRNALLFSSGSVGSNMASQLSLKQIARVIMKAAIDTTIFMNMRYTLRPKYCNVTPQKIMKTPSTLSTGW